MSASKDHVGVKAMRELFEWFAQPGASDFAHWTISMLALILAGFGTILGVLATRRERRIQTRLLAIEEERHANQRTEAKRAKVRANLKKLGPHDYLVIRNEGEADAWDVRVTLDGKPLLEHPIISHGEQEVRKIGPNSEVKYFARVTLQHRPPFEISIQWNDEAGEDRTYDSTLR